MMGVAFLIVMLTVIMLSVIILSVVAPCLWQIGRHDIQ
jgi:hypothetical protein